MSDHDMLWVIAVASAVTALANIYTHYAVLGMARTIEGWRRERAGDD